LASGLTEAEALGVDARDLWLDRARPHVRLRGKGRKERIVPLPSDLVGALKALMRERGLEAQEQRPLFVGTHGERLTRFGATHIVRRAVATATTSRPELASKSVSPQS
jgi:integrase/recombinase XerD